jgi:DNA-binding transcriptional LysR family regulator
MVPGMQHLQAFLAVCEEESFSGAAERLRVTQPAVSYRIAELERTLGVELFERPRRPVILTAAGQDLLGFCSRYFSELEVLVRSLPGRLWEPAEPIRIAASGAIGRFVLFPILTRPSFRHQAYRLLFRQPDEILQRVESGDCEMGFIYETRVTTTLEFREAGREEFVLVHAPGHGPKSGGLGGLEGAPFVTYEECDYVFGKWFDAVHGAQPRSVRSASHFERLEEVLAMTRLGRGLTIVPFHAVADDLRAGRLARLEVEGRRCLNTDYVVTRPGRTMRPEVEAIVEALVSGAPSRQG